MSKYPEIDLQKIKTYPFHKRKNKVHIADFANTYKPNSTINEFLQSLPNILQAKALQELISKIVKAIKEKSEIIVMMGAHIIKCGLAPILIDLMQRKIITALAFNGAGGIHDYELAMWGATSEDVATSLVDGTFGMVQETGEFMNKAIIYGASHKLGLGEALGEDLIKRKASYENLSLLATAYKLNIPLTIHIAIGTDIIHQHSYANGGAIGSSSYRDFRIFTQKLTNLDENSIILNLGSAVILPEVFLKALTITRNLGYNTYGFTTANFDMIQHYRPTVNVVQRPTLEGQGKGYAFTGHNEIMIPLLAAGILENL